MSHGCHLAPLTTIHQVVGPIKLCLILRHTHHLPRTSTTLKKKQNTLHTRKRDTNSNRQGNENERASYKTTVNKRQHETRTRKDCSLLRHPRPQDGRRAVAKARRDNEGTVNLSSQSHKSGETVPDHPQILNHRGGQPTQYW